MEMAKQFMVGGTSVIPAIVITHPLDTIKLRQQINAFQSSTPSSSNGRLPSSSFAATVMSAVRNDGALSLFSGLSPAIVRAYTFSATRLGLYEPIRNALSPSSASSSSSSSFSVKLCAALLSASCATFVGGPFELVKVRMQGGAHAYKNVFNGVSHIVRHEGLLTLWNGTQAGIIRASLFSCSQLATYDHTKSILRSHYPSLAQSAASTQLNFYAAMIAGLVTTTVSTPADFIKSVLMHGGGGGGKGERANVKSVFMSVVRKDGGRSFFKGWLANYARLGPHTVITMLTLEKIRLLIGWNAL